MNKTVTPLSRRKFISLAGGSALAVSLSGAKGLGANERIRVGIIGGGIRSLTLTGQFWNIPGVEVAAICDADRAQFTSLIDRVKKRWDIDISKVDYYQDYRKVYARKDIDAVVICAPNHWHTLMAIEAMEAGKHVYMEKPVTHNLWEGKQLLAAEKKYGKIVAAGTQNRSDPGIRDGFRYVNEGNLGKILSAHACCFKNRDSIGDRLAKPLVAPSTMDYNLWLGPAQDEPILRPSIHYDWHWIWNTGDGDIGNQAPHEIDMLCWLLGDGDLPNKISSFGGRFGWKDAGETPNMHTAWYEYGGVPCYIEVNDLKLAPDRNTPSMRDKVRIGNVIRCEGGELRGGRGGMYAVAEDGRTTLKKFPGDSGKTHQQNFIDAVRAGSSKGLRAPLKVSVKSAAIAHYANVSHRSGGDALEKRLRNQVKDDKILNTILDEQSTQLKSWGIDKPTYTRGQILRVNPKSGDIRNEGLEALVRPPYRGKFKVPELA